MGGAKLMKVDLKKNQENFKPDPPNQAVFSRVLEMRTDVSDEVRTKLGRAIVHVRGKSNDAHTKVACAHLVQKNFTEILGTVFLGGFFFTALFGCMDWKL
jgi:hypothetical protein